MKKSLFRGFMAGVLTLILAMLISAVLAVFFKMLIWPIISGVPYISNSGPIAVGSREWYLLQPFAALSAFLSGMTTAHWSKPKSWSALLLVLIIAIGLTIASPINTNSILNLAIWNLEVPFGLILGFYFYNKYH